MRFLKYFLFLSLFCLLSCHHTDEKSKNKLSVVVDRDRIWKVVVKVLKPYPIKEIDPYIGHIKTDLILARSIWKAPHEKAGDFRGYSYDLEIYLSYSEPIATVSIYKKAYRQEGFFTEKKPVPSDYTEEASLFYHIVRELEISKKLDL